MKIFEFEEFCHDAFPFGLIESKRQLECAIHAHDYTELVIVRKGTGLHLVNGRELPVRAGDVFVVAGNDSHAYRNVHDLILSNLLFKPSQLGLPLTYLEALPGYRALFKAEGEPEFCSRLRVGAEPLLNIDRLLGHIRLELSRRSPGYEAAILGIFIELLVFLARCFGEENEAWESRLVARLGQVVSRLENEYAGEISLASLAGTANVSPRTLLRYFHSVFGVSPADYLQNIRLAKAREWLTRSDLPIREIARRVGYPDHNYFSRLFRQKIGVAPGEFRKGATVN